MEEKTEKKGEVYVRLLSDEDRRMMDVRGVRYHFRQNENVKRNFSSVCTSKHKHMA